MRRAWSWRTASVHLRLVDPRHLLTCSEWRCMAETEKITRHSQGGDEHENKKDVGFIFKQFLKQIDVKSDRMHEDVWVKEDKCRHISCFSPACVLSWVHLHHYNILLPVSLFVARCVTALFFSWVSSPEPFCPIFTLFSALLLFIWLHLCITVPLSFFHLFSFLPVLTLVVVFTVPGSPVLYFPLLGAQLCLSCVSWFCSRASLAFCRVAETFFTTCSLFLCKRIAVTRTLSYWNQKLGHSTPAWVCQGGKIVTFPKKIPFVKCLLSVWLKGNTEIRFLELRFPSGAFSGLHNQLVYSVLCWRRWEIYHAEISPNYLLSCKPFNVITQQLDTHTQRASGGLLAADFWGIPEFWRESRGRDVRRASGCFAQGSESFWRLFYLTIRGNRNASSWILLTFRRSEICPW